MTIDRFHCTQQRGTMSTCGVAATSEHDSQQPVCATHCIVCANTKRSSNASHCAVCVCVVCVCGEHLCASVCVCVCVSGEHLCASVCVCACVCMFVCVIGVCVSCVCGMHVYVHEYVLSLSVRIADCSSTLPHASVSSLGIASTPSDVCSNMLVIVPR